jgi:excisionase family DNA binding protein
MPTAIGAAVPGGAHRCRWCPSLQGGHHRTGTTRHRCPGWCPLGTTPTRERGGCALTDRPVTDLAPPAPEQLLDAEQVAGLLAVSVSWVRREARAGRLPSISLGRAVRFRPSAVAAYQAELERRGDRGTRGRARP